MTVPKVTAYGFGPGVGMPDVSPFCCKLHAYGVFAGLDVRWEVGVAPRAPRGKLPWAEIDGVAVSDSGTIVEVLEGEVGLDAHLDERGRALSRVMRSALEEHVYFMLLHWRWVDPSGWAIYRGVIAEVIELGGVPAALTPLVRWAARRGVRRSLRAQGVGRMTGQELERTGAALVGAFEELLGDQEWLLGARPTTLDASAYGVLGGAWVPELANPLRVAVGEAPRLAAYLDRVHAMVMMEA